MAPRFFAILIAGLGSALALEAGSLPLFSPQIFTFPASGVGSPESRMLTLVNQTLFPLTLTGVAFTGPNAADFSIPAPGFCTLPCTVRAGQLLSGNILFNPSAAGPRGAQLVITLSGAPQQSILLLGEGVKPLKALALSVPDFAFPDIPIGVPNQTATASLTISNIGTVPVNFNAISIIGPNAGDFAIGTVSDNCTGALGQGKQCYLFIHFNPTAAGPRSAALGISDDAPGSPQLLSMTGFGAIAQAELQASPAILDFPGISTNAGSSQGGFVGNSGTAPVSITGVRVTGPNASDFTFTQNSCVNQNMTPVVLPPGPSGFCDFTIQFVPGALGPRLGAIEINSPQSPQTIPLVGQGVPPGLDLSVSPYQGFPPPSRSTSGAPPLNYIVDFSYSVTGSPTYQPLDVTNNGPSTVDLSFSVTGPDAADFSVSSTGNCGLPMEPGSDCGLFSPLSLTFTPSAPRLRTAALQMTDSVTGESQSVILTGSGLVAAPALHGNLLDFGPATVGSLATGIWALLNPGASPVTISAVSLQGSPSQDFSILGNACTPRPVLNQNASCQVTLQFAAASPGPRIAQITASYTGGAGPISAPVTGSGLPAASTMRFTGSPLDFGAVPVGSPAFPLTGGIFATGALPVEISSLSIAGPQASDFSILSSQCPVAPATLAPLQNCTINLQFQPSAPGLRQAFLVASDNAAGSPQLLPLLGQGNNRELPVLYVNPIYVSSYGAQQLGTTSEQTLKMSANPGPLQISGISVVGPTANDFTQATIAQPPSPRAPPVTSKSISRPRSRASAPPLFRSPTTA